MTQSASNSSLHTQHSSLLTPNSSFRILHSAFLTPHSTLLTPNSSFRINYEFDSVECSAFHKYYEFVYYDDGLWLMAYFTAGSEAFLLGGSRPLAIAIGHRFSTFRIPHSTLLIPHSAFIILHSAFIIPHSAFLLYPPELTINTHVCRSGAPRCCHD